VLGYGYDFRRAFHKCGRSCETRWPQKIVTTGSVVAASDFAAVTDFGHLSSHSVGLVPDDEHQRLILGSVASVMFFGYDDEFRRALLHFGRPYETRWSQKIVTTGSVVAASDFAAVTDFGHLHQRLILGSVASVMFFGYDDEFRRALLHFGRPYETRWSLQSLVTGSCCCRVQL
jgi:hypothetical protein